MVSLESLKKSDCVVLVGSNADEALQVIAMIPCLSRLITLIDTSNLGMRMSLSITCADFLLGVFFAFFGYDE